MNLFALDPGPTESGWLICTTAPFAVGVCGITSNEALLRDLAAPRWPFDMLVIERVESFGMPVGVEVFETVFWSGRFAQVVSPTPCGRLGRKAVKAHLCGTSRATNANVRQALLDKFGGPDAVGTKKAKGPLYGMKSHIWSALALAVTYAETQVSRPQIQQVIVGAPSVEEMLDASHVAARGPKGGA